MKNLNGVTSPTLLGDPVPPPLPGGTPIPVDHPSKHIKWVKSEIDHPISGSFSFEMRLPIPDPFTYCDGANLNRYDKAPAVTASAESDV